MKTEKIISNLVSNKDIQSKIKGLNYYSNEQFIKDAQCYIKAIKERRMLCNIVSVSSSGMSRVLKFNSCEKSSQKNQFYYRNYNCLFIALGFTQSKNDFAFRIGGCGMDMVFHTNYTIIHKFKNLGLISKQDCANLAQMTPTNI